MDFSFAGAYTDERYGWFAEGLRQVMEAHGHAWTDDAAQASLVVNFFDQANPTSFRRRAQAVFVVGVAEIDGFDRPVHDGYPILIRSLSNLLVGLVPGDAPDPDVHFLTPEQGHYVVSGNHDRSRYFEGIYRRIEPLATSCLVIDNIFDEDLPEELWDGDERTAAMFRAGQKLGALDLLPAPFPMEEVLNEREIRHIKRLYGIGGLSYGNVSTRHDESTFWMSASGVDKSHLKEIGREILLVKDFDRERNAMRISIPPGVEPRRVSVDAIEHWMIYREHPDVGAILHVHAWMEGIPSTEFNYPCGTYELGKAVADIIREADDPVHSVVGLKNHGVTITGENLDEIFERVEGELYQPVPME